jgi:glutamine synthetase
MEHERIVFDGNGYSEEWVEEAKRRGLPNLMTMVDAIPALTTEKSVALFEKFGVFTRAELESRAEIQYETYAKVINIEARSMIDIASKQLIPAAIRYTKELADTVIAVKNCGVDASVQEEILKETSVLLSEARAALTKLIELDSKGRKLERGEKPAKFFNKEVVPAMTAQRKPIDKLEMIVEKDMWPMPSYGDLIFEV